MIRLGLLLRSWTWIGLFGLVVVVVDCETAFDRPRPSPDSSERRMMMMMKQQSHNEHFKLIRDNNIITGRRIEDDYTANNSIIDNDEDNTNDDDEEEEEDSTISTIERFELPRFDVQFICGYDIDGPNDFNVTSFFTEDIVSNMYHLHTYMLDDVQKLELFPTVASSSISDITSNHWYYSMCNHSSTDTLVTIDVRGFVDLNTINITDPTKEFYANMTQEQLELQQEDNMKRFVHTVHDHPQYDVLEDLFERKVCNDMKFFRAKVLHWNSVLDPPPSSSSSNSDSGSTTFPNHHQQQQPHHHSSPAAAAHSSHNSNSHGYQHFYYDHNLYLLCGGAEEIIREGEPPDPGFVVVGILVGIIMVGMICGEVSQLPSFRRNTSTTRRNNRRDRDRDGSLSSSSPDGDGIMTTSSSSSSRRRGDYNTVQQEFEMTMLS